MTVDNPVWKCPTCGLVQHDGSIRRIGRRCLTCFERHWLTMQYEAYLETEKRKAMLPKPPTYAGPKTYNMVT